MTTAGDPGWGAGVGWSRSPAHVPLHLRHLQHYVPAGLSEGGRGRVNSSTHGQGRPGRRCVTLCEPHQGHVTVSQCHQTCHPPHCHRTCHPPQCHQTCSLPQPWGPFLLCALPLPLRPRWMLCGVYFYCSRWAGPGVLQAVVGGSSMTPPLPPQIFLCQHFGFALLLVSPCVHTQQCLGFALALFVVGLPKDTCGGCNLRAGQKTNRDPFTAVVILQCVPEPATHQ